MKANERLPIFYDPAGRRSRNLRRAGWPLAVIVTSLAAIFIASVLINPALPQLNLRQLSSLPAAADARLKAPPLITNRREQKAARAQAALNRMMKAYHGKMPAPVANLNRSFTRPLASGFYVNWDDSSYQSLKRHLQQLDQLIPEWLRLQAGDQPVDAEIDHRALDLVRAQRPDLPIIPMIHNSKDGIWDSQTLVKQLCDEASRTRLVDDLTRFVGENHFHGICIDFEEVPAKSQKNLLAFMRQLHAAFKEHNWTVMQAVPFDDSDWSYRQYAPVNDFLLLMAYDEHWNGSNPGSVAGQPWFEATLSRRMKELDPAKVVVCIGEYGYGWSKGHETEELTFQEAVLEARDSEAKIEFDPVTRNQIG